MFLVMVKCLMSSGLSSKMFQTVFSLLFSPGSHLDACKVFTHPAPNSCKTVKGLKSMTDLKFQAFQYTSKRAYPEVELYFLQNSLHSKLSLSGTVLAIFKDLYNYILTNMFFKVIQQWLLTQRAYSGMVREMELWESGFTLGVSPSEFILKLQLQFVKYLATIIVNSLCPNAWPFKISTCALNNMPGS